jgi:hypothetical protein
MYALHVIKAKNCKEVFKRNGCKYCPSALTCRYLYYLQKGDTTPCKTN